MKNVDLQVSGDILTIKIDLSDDYGPSKSGKSTIIASTEGNIIIPDTDVKLGLNCYR